MKIGLIYSFAESDWFSVTKIVQNLLESYKLALKDAHVEHINYSVHLTPEENEKNAKEALDKNLDKIIFLDHKPHLIHFLPLISRHGKEKLKEVIVHVFGDFTLSFLNWKRTEVFLENKKVKFICASDKQVKLIQKFVKQNIVFKSPFPVDKKHFYCDFSKREQVRKDLGFATDDFLFLYTGRLSELKGVKELIYTFLKLKSEKKLNPEHKLVLAGKFGLVDSPYMPGKQVLGEYYRHAQSIIESHPEEIARDVVFLGNIPNQNLTTYLNTADKFVSLSYYQDEDYGMSVAESFMAGLPGVLTDWAGYSSFKMSEMEEATRFIPVKFEHKKIFVDEAKLEEVLIKSKEERFPDEKRKRFASLFASQFSIEACSTSLKALEEKDVEEFSGYTDLLHLLGSVSAFKWQIFLDEHTKELNDFYFKVYDVYFEQD